jgi:hypothetical protein
MQFLVIGRMIDAAVMPPEQELAVLKETFERFANNGDHRIKAVYPYADQRATAFVAEVESADELTALISSLPANRVSTFEAHPIASPAGIVGVIAEWERALAQQPA